jgi:hypothetical protein
MLAPSGNFENGMRSGEYVPVDYSNLLGQLQFRLDGRVVSPV